MVDVHVAAAGNFRAGSAFSALVVDDDGITRRFATRILERLGAVRVVEAADGAAALACLEAEAASVDLILCDLRMPGLDGIDTLRRLADRNVSALIVLVSSADSRTLRSASQLAKQFGIGLLRTIAKPLSVQKLQEIFAEVCSLTETLRDADQGFAARPVIDAAMIREGLARKEFVAYYQPKVNLRTSQVVGAEALVRWIRPGVGVLQPAAFLPVTRASGLLDAMTEAVFNQAAVQCAAWARAGETLSVSVNLNAATLGSRDLLARLEATVAALRLDPASIIFELTEDGLLQRHIAREVLTRLRLRGFGLSIDDFGTGYSTLQQLLEAPFNELKIDQCFVKSAPRDREAAVALSSSIALAQQLGLNVVGEGVETDAQWRFLEQAGCAIGQGYAIARPMAAEAFPAWAAAWRSKPGPRVEPAPCAAASPA